MSTIFRSATNFTKIAIFRNSRIFFAIFGKIVVPVESFNKFQLNFPRSFKMLLEMTRAQQEHTITANFTKILITIITNFRSFRKFRRRVQSSVDISHKADELPIIASVCITVHESALSLGSALTY